MKAIILISSIFYILGLKISDKIDFIKKPCPVEKVTIHTTKPEAPEKTVDFNEIQTEKKATNAVEEENNET